MGLIFKYRYSDEEYKVSIIIDNYPDTDNLYVGLLDEYHESVISITINYPEKLRCNYAYVRIGENAEVLDFLIQNRLGKILKPRGSLGFKGAPMVRFYMYELKKYTSWKKKDIIGLNI